MLSTQTTYPPSVRIHVPMTYEPIYPVNEIGPKNTAPAYLATEICAKTPPTKDYLVLKLGLLNPVPAGSPVQLQRAIPLFIFQLFLMNLGCMFSLHIM